MSRSGGPLGVARSGRRPWAARGADRGAAVAGRVAGRRCAGPCGRAAGRCPEGLEP